ncbi:MAG: dipeptidase [Pseudomonadota bacterium]
MRTDASLDAVLQRIDADLEQSLERLFALMRIPSISTKAAHRADCRAAADWLAGELTALGYAPELIATPEVPDGHPMVVARRPGAPGAPRALFYGHYDVQPVDPLDLWAHPPFEPFLETRADGAKAIRGRGASDDKGQLMTFLEAVRAWVAVAGAPPVDVAFLLEGEEESGGASMAPFLKRHGAALKADVALVCDTGMWSAERPAITTSLRGLMAATVTIKAASRDLHSGAYGSAARNPIAVLSQILSDLRDEAGAVTLPGFYKGVPEIPPEIRAQWAELGFDEAAFLGEIGLSEPAGEAGFSALEQIWARPTAEINGISGGYQEDGFKTVIPAEAMAKVSFRLVGDQDPEAVWRAFEAHVKAHTPADCEAVLERHGGAPASRLDYGHPDLKRAAAALDAEWAQPTALIAGGGSIPVAGEFKSILGMETLLIGFALESDRIHSPNEQYELTSFHKGVRSWARILGALAEDGPAAR